MCWPDVMTRGQAKSWPSLWTTFTKLRGYSFGMLWEMILHSLVQIAKGNLPLVRVVGFLPFIFSFFSFNWFLPKKRRAQLVRDLYSCNPEAEERNSGWTDWACGEKVGGLRSARQVLVRFPNPDQAGTPSICQVPQPILGRHARYAPGVKIGKSSSTLKPTHMLVAIHGANQWSDLNPWYGRTQSKEVIAMCFTADTWMQGTQFFTWV